MIRGIIKLETIRNEYSCLTFRRDRKRVNDICLFGPDLYEPHSVWHFIDKQLLVLQLPRFVKIHYVITEKSKIWKLMDRRGSKQHSFTNSSTEAWISLKLHEKGTHREKRHGDCTQCCPCINIHQILWYLKNVQCHCVLSAVTRRW